MTLKIFLSISKSLFIYPQGLPVARSRAIYVSLNVTEKVYIIDSSEFLCYIYFTVHQFYPYIDCYCIPLCIYLTNFPGRREREGL